MRGQLGWHCLGNHSKNAFQTDGQQGRIVDASVVKVGSALTRRFGQPVQQHVRCPLRIHSLAFGVVYAHRSYHDSCNTEQGRRNALCQRIKCQHRGYDPSTGHCAPARKITQHIERTNNKLFIVVGNCGKHFCQNTLQRASLSHRILFALSLLFMVVLFF